MGEENRLISVKPGVSGYGFIRGDMLPCFRVGRQNHESGFTLVELMMAMGIAGIVMGALMTSYIAQQRIAVRQEQIAEMQQNIRAGLYMMEREIRLVGFDPSGSAGAGIVSAAAGRFEFSFVADNDGIDNDGDGSTDESNELEQVAYDVYDSGGDGDMDLGRRDGTSALRMLLAENVHAVEFFYTLDDGTTTTAPDDLNRIRSVQISLLARTDLQDESFSNTTHYIPASGKMNWDLNGGRAGIDNPVNDGFHRRLLITTIECRNMGL